jgi:uncharacterized protein YdeI (YjbR/CyaY-like superfamily)
MATKTDKRINAYIDNAADFAKPILQHLRKLIHKTCPEVEETVKWGYPHFEYKGMLCHLAAFKNHCSFSFYKGEMLKDELKLLNGMEKASMAHFGKLTSLKDLPSDKILATYIKEAMKLNEEGIKKESKPKAKVKQELEIPAYFMNALKKNKQALKSFEGFSPTNKKEYVEWVTGAKTDATRDSRLETAIEWMAEGKVRNWKYIKS